MKLILATILLALSATSHARCYNVQAHQEFWDLVEPQSRAFCEQGRGRLMYQGVEDCLDQQFTALGQIAAFCEDDFTQEQFEAAVREHSIMRRTGEIAQVNWTRVKFELDLVKVGAK